MSGIGAGLAALNLGARLTGIGGFFKRVPRWVWIALAIVLAAVAIWIWHGRQVAAHDKALTAKVTAQVNARWEASVEQLRQKALTLARMAEGKAARINSQLKGRHDEQVRNIGARADDQRLRGPGAAAATRCGPGNPAGVPGGAGRPGQASGAAGPGLGPVPAVEGAAIVPWGGLVGVAERCDVNRSEVLTWRSWHAQQAAAWEDYRRQLQAAAAGKGKKGSTDGR